MDRLITLPEVATASAHCLRWRDRRHSWRRRSEGGFDPAGYLVEPIAERAAKGFVLAHHYSRAYPAAVNRYGLVDTRDGLARLVGVAVFGVPVQPAVLTSAFPTLQPYRESQELSRFVLLDEVPANAESWFLARCFGELRAAGVRGVVSFADPVPRRTSAGRVIAPGHVGTIYQASGATYTGRATARTLTLLPDGTVLNARAAQKVRQGEVGHDYVERRLVDLGARPPAGGEDMTVWLRSALAAVGVSRIRHPGAHRYVFRLGRNARERHRIPLGLPSGRYPKQPDPDQPELF
jgi:hypothetical protein